MRCGAAAASTPPPALAAWARRLRTASRPVAASAASAVEGGGGGGSGGGGGGTAPRRRARLVFLGTPPPAASILTSLLNAAASPASPFEVAAVVTQPPKRQGRGRKAAPPSAVASLALSRGFAASEGGGGEGPASPSTSAAAPPPPPLLTPASASDPSFLAALAALNPDLCITAAYGLILPAAFLSLPRVGTLNVHPSLLPRWRGAAPVPRALEAGDAVSGVTVAWTVAALDAGPILGVEKVAVGRGVSGPDLLDDLMERGARLLLARLPAALAFPDAAAAMAAGTPQDATGRAVTHAARLSKAEAGLDFFGAGRGPALEGVWNRVRAFAGWPVAWAAVSVGDAPDAAAWVPLKILEAHPVDREAGAGGGGAVAGEEGGGGDGGAGGSAPLRALRVATPRGGPLLFPCRDGSGDLAVTRVQAPGGKALDAGDYVNGLAGRGLWVLPPPAEVT